MEIEDRLRAKIEAVNKANKLAHQLYETLVPIFTPFVGLKVITVDGDLLTKVQKLLVSPVLRRAFPGENTNRIKSAYAIKWVVSVSVNLGNASVSHSESVAIGELDGQTLSRISPPFEGRTDWTPEEVVSGRVKAYRAKREYKAIVQSLYPFGEG